MLFAFAQVPAPSAAEIVKQLPQPIFLWPNGAPGALGAAEADKPRIYPFVPQTKSTTTAVLVIPGGGYEHVAIGHEGFQYAHWLNAQGITAFVLDYRVAPYKYPVEIQDGMRALRYMRAHTAEYGIDPNRIGVWGSSAGGHLASTLGVHGNDAASPPDDDPLNQVDARPNFMILAYPVISMTLPEAHIGSRRNLLGETPDPELEHKLSNQLTADSQTPPSFIFATTGDPTVPIENSLDFYRALERAHVPVELHIYDYANHGCGLCGDIPELSTWPLLLRNWLIHSGWMPKDAPPLPPIEARYPSWPEGLEGPGKSH
ncbi:MAG TPA: alpha/beta hydrolase [Pseudacidobacterium sp.]|nr:alpha/beta hydrolase [Pseudacidobacterium sp.]